VMRWEDSIAGFDKRPGALQLHVAVHLPLLFFLVPIGTLIVVISELSTPLLWALWLGGVALLGGSLATWAWTSFHPRHRRT